MTTEEKIGVKIPEILLPVKGIDLTKWAVIACDQFTSQPQYWKSVAGLVGDSPSTFHMILPEIYLEKPDVAEHISRTHIAMRKYLEEGIFRPFTGLIYVERTIGNVTRHGLMIALDLEAYDFSTGSQTLIRATEGTILDRLPPRMRIRKEAPLETPHILVLYDDPDSTVLAPVFDKAPALEVCYDFDLMQGSGHLTGRLISDSAIIQQILDALEQLADPGKFADKYHLPGSYQPLLFAMGDGNHSLATAKAIWEELKPQVSMHHPARHALVEIENLHDPALEFEPIHRVLFNLSTDILADLQTWFGNRMLVTPVSDLKTWVDDIDKVSSMHHHFGLLTGEGPIHIEIKRPDYNLPVGSLQGFLDEYLKNHPSVRIDYVHGREILVELGSKPNNAGFYLPAMPKADLFKTVILDGALPRKTFSMGEARDKRFYMECRRIR